jgi:hypothetical protein
MSAPLPASHPQFLIPAGDWSGWLGAAGTLLVVIVGLYQWRQDRRRGLELQEQAQILRESEQACRISGLLRVAKESGKTVLQVLVLNTSDLPILDVTMSYETIHKLPNGQLEPMQYEYNIPVPYVMPHTTYELDAKMIIEGESAPVQTSVAVSFRDSNGIWWRNVTGRPPQKQRAAPK